MILEGETFEAFGYYSYDFKKTSWKLIVSVCTLCGRIKITPKHDYYTFCQSCVQKGKKQTEEAKVKKSAALKGKIHPNRKPKIKCICQWCEKEFPVSESDVKRGRGKYCSRKCSNKAHEGKGNPMFGVTSPMKGKLHTEESKALISAANTGKKPTAEAKALMSIAAHKRMHNAHPHMTVPENVFKDICFKNNLPFKFVGDGSLWLGNANPDFIHTGRRKLVVEVFGDYWHSLLLNSKVRYNATVEGRRTQLKVEGYKSIFIWESDLKRKDAEAFVMHLMHNEGII